MIAKISVSKTSILDEMMLCPFSLKYLSQNGIQPGDTGKRGMHHDGCGMAFSHDSQVEIHKRSKDDAWNDSYQQVVRQAASNIFIAHNRLASKGLLMNAAVAHPFSVTASGKTFAFCHNGGVRSYMDQAKDQHTSDSFIFLQKLIDPAEKNDGTAILSRLKSIEKETDYNSLCAFLMTADELFVWRIYNENDHDKREEYEKYYTLYMSMRNNSIRFSSEPLDELPWMLLENKTFLHLHFSGGLLAVEYMQV